LSSKVKCTPSFFCDLFSIQDLGKFVVEKVFYQLPIYDFTMDFFGSVVPNRWLAIPVFLKYFLGYAEILIHALIALNRLSSTILLTNYTQVCGWFVVCGELGLFVPIQNNGRKRCCDPVGILPSFLAPPPPSAKIFLSRY
jgi:hypothetical protein